MYAGVAELRREIAIGVADGDQNLMIGAIDDIAVAGNGTIYVLDKSVPAIRVYDAAGKFVKNIGRRGRGPGEFQSAAGLTIAKNGNLLLWDPGNARVNVYAPGGDVIASWQTMGNSGSAGGRRLIMSDTTGVTYVRTMIWPKDRTGPVRPKQGWIRFAVDGAIRDTVFEPKGPDESLLIAQRGGATKTNNVPFSPVYYSAVSPLGYFVTGLSSRIAIDLHEPGKPIASIRRDVATQSVSSHERDSARAEVTESMRSTDPGWSWNGPDIPKTKSVFSQLFAAADGRLWVQLARGPRLDDPSVPGGGGSVSIGGGNRPGGLVRGSSWSCPSNGWSLSDVYEPSGRYVGQVRVPERVESIVQRGDYIWAATCTEDDVPQVVRYRIVWR